MEFRILFPSIQFEIRVYNTGWSKWLGTTEPILYQHFEDFMALIRRGFSSSFSNPLCRVSQQIVWSSSRCLQAWLPSHHSEPVSNWLLRLTCRWPVVHPMGRATHFLVPAAIGSRTLECEPEVFCQHAVHDHTPAACVLLLIQYHSLSSSGRGVFPGCGCPGFSAGFRVHNCHSHSK